MNRIISFESATRRSVRVVWDVSQNNRQWRVQFVGEVMQKVTSA